MHSLRRGVRAPEQTDAAHSDDAHARHAQVPRRAAGAAAGAAAVRGALPRHARGGAAGAGAGRRARERGALQVLRQELPRRVLAHRAPAGAHRRPPLQVRVLREGLQAQAPYEGPL